MMHAHFSVHQEHGPNGRLSWVAREVVAVYAWLSGPAWSERERLRRELAEAGSWRNLTGVL